MTTRKPRLTRLATFAVLAFLLLSLQGCLLESDEAVLTEREKAGALNVFADTVPDISGSYVLADPKADSKRSKPMLSVRFSRDETSANAFIMENLQEKKEPQRILVEKLPGDKRVLLQIRDRSAFNLIPAELVEDGLRVYVPGGGSSKENSGWNRETWDAMLAKHGLTAAARKPFSLRRGSLAAKDYAAKVTAALADMFAAKAFGQGLLLVKSERYEAVREKEAALESFILSCSTASPGDIRKGLRDGVSADTPNRHGLTPLMFAAMSNGNVESVKALLDAGGSIDMGDKDGNSSLMLATGSNPNPRILAALIAAGGKVSHKNKQGRTALMLAKNAEPFKEKADMLMKAGAQVDERDTDGKTALMLAAAEGNIPFVEFLLHNKADSNIRDNEGRTALLAAVMSGRKDLADVLQKAGADPSIKDNRGNSVFGMMLQNADLAKDAERIFAMLDKGADVNTPFGYRKETLIMRALREKTPELFARLLRYSPDLKPNGQSVFEAFAKITYSQKGPLLQWAMPAINDPATVAYLAHNGADVKERAKDGSSALIAATRANRDAAVIKKLLELGADVGARTGEEGYSALFFAALHGNLDAYRALRDAGADPMATGSGDENILMMAAQGGNVEIIKAQLAAGLDANAVSKKGATALALATQSGNAAAVKTLLEAGATLPESLFVAAAANAKEDMLELLRAAGAKPAAVDKDGMTALMLAAGSNPHPGVIRYLHGLGVDVNAKNTAGYTALHLAAGKNPNPDVITALLQCGADRDVAVQEYYMQKNALHFAAEKSENPEVLKKLILAGADINQGIKDTNSGSGPWTPLQLVARRDFANAPQMLEFLLDWGADGRMKAQHSYQERTAYQLVPYNSPVKKLPLYTRLSDAQFNAPKALSEAQIAERDACQKSIRTAPKAPATAPVAKIPAPQAAPASNATESAAQPPAPAAEPPAKAESPAARTYPPLVPAANGKPKIVGHFVGMAKGTVTLDLQVLAPGKSVEAVRIDNLGGVSARWRSDGKENADPLSVVHAGKALGAGRDGVPLAAGDKEILLTLSLTDNGAFAVKGAQFRATVFFSGGGRAMCQIDAK